MERKDIKLTKHHFLAWGIVTAAIAVVSGAFILANTYFHDKALPGSSLASIDVTGKDRQELTEMIGKVKKSIKLEITVDKKTVTATADDLGIKIDTIRTVDNILNYEGSNPMSSANFLVKRPVRLVATRDNKKLQQYLDKAFVDQLVWVQDAGIQYDDGVGRFVVVAAQPGTKVKAESLKPTVVSLIENPRAEKLKLKPTVEQPAISNQAAEEAAGYMNQRLGLRLNLNYKGRLIYYADPPDIAKWIIAKPDKDRGKIGIDFSEEAVAGFLNGTVAPYIASTPVDSKVLVDKSGREIAVLTHGRNGYKIRDTSAAARALVGAVKSNQGINQELDIEEAGHGRVTITAAEGERWIEVNLSTQTATLWTGSSVVASHRISSGTAATPTRPGEFRVWHKVRVQTMKGIINGEAYNVPNVEWISYFDGGEAFHATYWHNNFGTPMSHGCINMTYEAAEFLYNFAPVGTRVVVHY
ncbi:MAG: L,D-transpeptidase/peptidoglycan binding protein [Candidatus Nomurabacteria bacterium]|jgi:lipoprotein-anchoring transpeptidase ErfK/SrfK|nr:L,D-transpeptidase/peptidoglycan binding protein [Candidatus Nomurabacteria bacterium]